MLGWLPGASFCLLLCQHRAPGHPFLGCSLHPRSSCIPFGDSRHILCEGLWFLMPLGLGPHCRELSFAQGYFFPRSYFHSPEQCEPLPRALLALCMPHAHNAVVLGLCHLLTAQAGKSCFSKWVSWALHRCWHCRHLQDRNHIPKSWQKPPKQLQQQQKKSQGKKNNPKALQQGVVEIKSFYIPGAGPSPFIAPSFFFSPDPFVEPPLHCPLIQLKRSLAAFQQHKEATPQGVLYLY